jgi:hypothetical protein
MGTETVSDGKEISYAEETMPNTKDAASTL